MRAVAFGHSGPRVVVRPDPEPGTNQLLVRVRAAGLNGADLLQAQGNYPPPPGAPDTPGLELAGEVVGLGTQCRDHALGDRVMAVVQGGAQAELCLVDERLAMPVPAGLAWEAAGAAPEVFATAHDALFSQAELSLGERVCIHGAAGGVGSAAVQLAALAGAKVTATVRNPAGRRPVASLGAEVVTPTGFVDHGPYDVILELVGAPNWPANLDALAVEGRICVIGVGAGTIVELNLFDQMRKRARIMASTMRARPVEQRAVVARQLERHVLPLLSSGDLRVPVAATFDLDDAAAAYEHFSRPGKVGKVVLRP